MKGIAEWLESIGLAEYAQRFAENAIDISDPKRTLGAGRLRVTNDAILDPKM
jgi:hypothetical protein